MVEMAECAEQMANIKKKKTTTTEAKNNKTDYKDFWESFILQTAQQNIASYIVQRVLTMVAKMRGKAFGKAVEPKLLEIFCLGYTVMKMTNDMKCIRRMSQFNHYNAV